MKLGNILYIKRVGAPRLWQFRQIRGRASYEDLKVIARHFWRLRKKFYWRTISGAPCIECMTTDEEAQQIQDEYPRIVAHPISREMRTRGGEVSVARRK